jgi:cyclophilin family peptidyl-prolyl cis-trans isomerase
VGTDKRERQKANRQQKLEEMARNARRAKTKRRGLQFGIGVPLLIVVVFGLVRLFGSDDSSTKSVSDASTTTLSASDLGSLPAEDTTPTSVSPTTVPLVTVLGTQPTPNAAGQFPCPATDGSAGRVIVFPKAPPSCLDSGKTYTALITTSLGKFTVTLDQAKAPLTVNNFVYLARYHYFDETPCHRVVPDFVAQCGDPTGTGGGGPGYSFADELPKAGDYKVGSLAMANSGANTNGSQFFVITGAQGAALPAQYSLFGQVTDGLDTVTAINAVAVADGVPPSKPVTIQSVVITEQ